jgi:hypothetical protein
MKSIWGAAGALFLSLFGTGCGVLNSDAGPVQTANVDIDAGKAEAVRAEIHMSSGELHIQGGAAKLMVSTLRYSEKIGRPDVRYDLTGAGGVLTVESVKKDSSLGNKVNEWNLRMGGETPLDMHVTLGAGTADLDMSRLPLHALEVNMGAGEMTLNVAGKYPKDVNVIVTGGAGEARIRLPKDMGAVVEATVGIGGVDVKGLIKRDGKYYNDAYAEGKPAVHLEVHGGVGELTLSAE